MKQKYIIAFFTALTVFSCKKKHDIELLIAGEDYKYWQLVDPCKTSKTSTIYKFTKSGEWETYKKYANGEFAKERNSDISFDLKWYLIDDSTLYGGLKYKIIAIHEDVFILKHKYLLTLIPPHDTMLRTTYKYENVVKPKLKVNVIKLD